MSQRRLSFRELEKILKSFGIIYVHPSGGGSHGKFLKNTENGRISYPVPYGTDLPCYTRQCRKKFGLRREDGISDDDFFGRR